MKRMLAVVVLGFFASTMAQATEGTQYLAQFEKVEGREVKVRTTLRIMPSGAVFFGRCAEVDQPCHLRRASTLNVEELLRLEEGVSRSSASKVEEVRTLVDSERDTSQVSYRGLGGKVTIMEYGSPQGTLLMNAADEAQDAIEILDWYRAEVE